jgi:dTDP-glucose pyrophosphorylase
MKLFLDIISQTHNAMVFGVLSMTARFEKLLKTEVSIKNYAVIGLYFFDETAREWFKLVNL